MPRLRAIGGPRDGEWIDAPEHLRLGGTMRVPEQLRSVVAVWDQEGRRAFPGATTVAEPPVAFPSHSYRLEQLQFWSARECPPIEFLVYSAWSLPDAVERVLIEWGPQADASE